MSLAVLVEHLAQIEQRTGQQKARQRQHPEEQKRIEDSQDAPQVEGDLLGRQPRQCGRGAVRDRTQGDQNRSHHGGGGGPTGQLLRALKRRECGFSHLRTPLKSDDNELSSYNNFVKRWVRDG